MDNPASQHQHDSDAASSLSDGDQRCIDTADFADCVWLKGSRYSYTQTLDPSLDDPDLEKRCDLHPKRHRPRNGHHEGQEDRSLNDERAGEPGYLPGRVEKWAVRVAAAANNNNNNNNFASHSQQLRERTARLRSRERAAIDATVTMLEKSQSVVPGPTSPGSAAARETLCSLVESNSGSSTAPQHFHLVPTDFCGFRKCARHVHGEQVVSERRVPVSAVSAAQPQHR